ncbi:hypothetical protein U9M48_026271 [Paspalum notatum var. saurae]|uniref:Uncharacterized protein n=1 Tax=Paspalum notatum var. saurae TaxID=547442 RepID=A0AAQ3WYL8_PASNO
MAFRLRSTWNRPEAEKLAGMAPESPPLLARMSTLRLGGDDDGSSRPAGMAPERRLPPRSSVCRSGSPASDSGTGPPEAAEAGPDARRDGPRDAARVEDEVRERAERRQRGRERPREPRGVGEAGAEREHGHAKRRVGRRLRLLVVAVGVGRAHDAGVLARAARVVPGVEEAGARKVPQRRAEVAQRRRVALVQCGRLRAELEDWDEEDEEEGRQRHVRGLGAGEEDKRLACGGMVEASKGLEQRVRVIDVGARCREPQPGAVPLPVPVPVPVQADPAGGMSSLSEGEAEEEPTALPWVSIMRPESVSLRRAAKMMKCDLQTIVQD